MNISVDVLTLHRPMTIWKRWVWAWNSCSGLSHKCLKVIKESWATLIIQQVSTNWSEDRLFNQSKSMLIRNVKMCKYCDDNLRAHTHTRRQAGRQGCPLKPAFSGPRTVLASVKPPQACHRNGTAINLTDIIQSDGWGGDKTGVCVCVCACVLCSATITCYGIQPRVPAMSAACCKTQRICFLFIFLFHWGSQSDTILLDWHVGGSDVRSGSFRWC